MYTLGLSPSPGYKYRCNRPKIFQNTSEYLKTYLRHSFYHSNSVYLPMAATNVIISYNNRITLDSFGLLSTNGGSPSYRKMSSGPTIRPANINKQPWDATLYYGGASSHYKISSSLQYAPQISRSNLGIQPFIMGEPPPTTR